MMKSVAIRLDQIYVPTGLRKGLDTAKVDALAEDIAGNGLQTPIQVRRDKDRYVLVTGLHRLEAARALGESTIQALIVAARQH
jgi:ParB-like chromosome segregation protein Spo0J